MSNIQEKIYVEKLKQSPEEVQNYIRSLNKNNSFLFYVNKYRNSINEKEQRIETLKSKMSLLLLGIESIDNIVDSLIEALDIQPLEAEDMITDFFSTCLPQSLQDFIDNIASQVQEADYDHGTQTGSTETNNLSHINILDEIENPTPSLKTTASFANKPANAPVKAATQTSSTTTAVTTATPTNQPTKIKTSIEAIQPSAHLGGFADNATGNMHPAEKVAAKLGQNLTAPSASIPKEVYIPKRPDPYHEPIE